MRDLREIFYNVIKRAKEAGFNGFTLLGIITLLAIAFNAIYESIKGFLK